MADPVLREAADHVARAIKILGDSYGKGRVEVECAARAACFDAKRALDAALSASARPAAGVCEAAEAVFTAERRLWDEYGEVSWDSEPTEVTRLIVALRSATDALRAALSAPAPVPPFPDFTDSQVNSLAAAMCAASGVSFNNMNAPLQDLQVRKARVALAWMRDALTSGAPDYTPPATRHA